MGMFRLTLRFYFGIQALSAFYTLPSSYIQGLFHGATLLPLLLVPAMACWSLGRGKPSARWWAIAASLLSIVAAGPLNRWFSIAMGMVGLVTFGRKPVKLPSVEVKTRVRIAGDGTSLITEYAAMGAGLSGYLCGMYLWFQWGKQHGLSDLGFTAELLLSQVALLIETACHELGHVLAGRIAGMVLWTLRVGPFHWKKRNGKWAFLFRPNNWFGGSAGMVAPQLTRLNERTAVMILGGPIASLLLGAGSCFAVFGVIGTSWEFLWTPLAILSIISLVSFLINMIPQMPGSNYSDGARFYQLMKKGPWEQVNLAMGMVASALITKLRPRDFDIHLIERAADFVGTGQQGSCLRWFAAMHHRDKGQVLEAVTEAKRAEELFELAQWEEPHAMLASFVYFDAVFRQDRESAERWWSELRTLPAKEKDADVYLAQASIQWLRGDLESAWEAWECGYCLALELPSCGAYDDTRKCFEVLREGLRLERRTEYRVQTKLHPFPGPTARKPAANH